MTDLQRQAKETADSLKSMVDDWDIYATACQLLRRIERGELVEVVRCGECKYSEPLKPHADLYQQDLMNCTCQHGEEVRNVWHKYSKQYHDYSLVDPNEFCSNGERMEDANANP